MVMRYPGGPGQSHPRVTDAEAYEGDLAFLAGRGVEIALLDDPDCVAASASSSSATPVLERGHRRPLNRSPQPK